MKFIIFFLCVPLVYSEIHKFITTYTGLNEQTAAGIPEFFAVTTLDGDQIDYYDSNIRKIIPKQDWMEEFTFTEMWKKDTKIREDVHQIYKNNIRVIMQRFNQSGGVHTYQRMYGCVLDDETGKSYGFDRYAYDGEDFITLGVNGRRYNTSVPQASPTVMKWNNDKEQLASLKRYYDHECIYWLKYLLALKKTQPTNFKRREPSNANVVALVMCVMGVLTVLVIGIAVRFKLKRIGGYKRVSSKEETYSDKLL